MTSKSFAKSVLAAAVGATIVLGGCADPGSEERATSDPSTTAAPTTVDGGGQTSDAPTATMSGSRAVVYTDIAGLWADSTYIVRGTATDAVESGGAPGPITDEPVAPALPWTVTSFEIDEVLLARDGAATLDAGGTIDIRQLGNSEVIMEDGAPILGSGAEYVLFVEPFELEPGEPTSDYVITGAAGAYGVADDGSLTALDAQSEALPSGITEAELVAAATE